MKSEKGGSATPHQPRLPVLRRDNLRGLRREPPRLPLRRELAFAAALRRQKTEGEIMRGCCLHQGADEHQVKKRSFAFSLAYIKCFLAYSLSLSLRLPAQILYAGIHLPPQREARALPRRAQKSTASAIRSRTCGRQRLAFLAVSATGGARKPNPSEGGEGAPAPCSDLLLRAALLPAPTLPTDH